jgi:hypothetical protein
MKPDDFETTRLRQFCIVTLQYLLARMPSELAGPLQTTIENLRTTPKRFLPIGDILEWTADLTGDEITSLDHTLKDASAPTLTATRLQYWSKRIPSILRRRRIRSDVEYYLLKEVADGSGSQLSSDQIALARSLVDAYAVPATTMSGPDARK